MAVRRAPAKVSRDGWTAGRDVVEVVVVSAIAGPAKVLKSEGRSQEAIKRSGVLF